jgi:DNA-binding NtrC family response regulator
MTQRKEPTVQQVSRHRLAILSHDLTTIRIISDAVSHRLEAASMRDAQGLLALIRHDVPLHAVMIDNAAPQFNAIEVLQSVKGLRATARRILITEHCDLGMIVQGLHTRAVERIVYKPICLPEALAALDIECAPIAASAQRSAPRAAPPLGRGSKDPRSSAAVAS